jgi:two-component system cell cycle sensor histidine kinase/response regulator CckA
LADEAQPRPDVALEPRLEVGPAFVDARSWQADGVLDAIDEGLQILDHEWRYVYINASAARHGQRAKEELLGRNMLEVYPGIEQTAMFEHLQRCMRDGISHQMDNEFTYLDGSKEWFEIRIERVPHGVLVLSVGIGERRRLEAQLAHAQKMEAVGRLAGGVAHDFNNLLTVIISYAEFLSNAAQVGSELARDVEEIRAAAGRGAKLTRHLLALSRRQVITPSVVSPNTAIQELEPMLQRLAGESIEVRSILSARVGMIRVDSGQLDQVLMNLVANARDAMTQGGQITLRTDNIELDQAYADEHADVKAGPHVVIAVTDHGCGMDAATLERMFEPFFTTKPVGRGTGLGLATSHGIVRQNGGHIWVYSELGHGSTFKLYFPRVFDGLPLARLSMPAPLLDLRGHEVVMVVDDEASLRTLCVRVLKEQGYTVLEAETPSEALRFSAKFSGRIDAIVTDVVMPEMSGPELIEQLVLSRPDLRTLFMSGYADHDMLLALEASQCLEKPFTPEALARKLRQVLSSTESH